MLPWKFWGKKKILIFDKYDLTRNPNATGYRIIRTITLLMRSISINANFMRDAQGGSGFHPKNRYN